MTSADAPPGGSGIAASPENADVLANIVARLREDVVRYGLAIILPAVLSIAGAAVFTRVFSPAAYGQYSLVLAAATTAIWIFGGWLQQSVLRYLPRYRDRGEIGTFIANLTPTLWMLVGALIVLSAALYPAIRPLLAEGGRFLFPAVLLVAAWTVFLVLNAANQASLDSAAFARYQVVQAVLRLGLALVLVFWVGRDVIWLIVAPALAYALPLPLMAHRWRGVRGAGARLDRAFVGRLAAYGVPVVGWMLAVTVLDLSDRFVIGLFRGAGEVGVYSANYNLATMLMTFVGVPVLLAAEPLVINSWEKGNREGIAHLIRSLSRYYLLIIAPVTVFAAVFSGPLAGIVFGEEFRAGSRIIPIVLSGLVLWYFGLFGSKGLKLSEKTGLMLALVLVCTVVNVGLNFVVVPRYGYVGAAWTTTISYALYPLMIYQATKRHVVWLIPWRSIARVGGGSAAVGVAWWFAGSRLPGGPGWLGLVGFGIAGMVLYVFVLAAVGELTGDERRGMKRVLRGILPGN